MWECLVCYTKFIVILSSINHFAASIVYSMERLKVSTHFASLKLLPSQADHNQSFPSSVCHNIPTMPIKPSHFQISLSMAEVNQPRHWDDSPSFCESSMTSKFKETIRLFSPSPLSLFEQSPAAALTRLTNRPLWIDLNRLSLSRLID